MSNYGLMVYDFYKYGEEVNIGDYIQSIAARQFLPKVDKYLEREYLDEELDKEYKLIMNGWFMHGNHWPPNDKIIPKFVSFHINSKAENVLLNANSIEYLKKQAPIGCRDKRTAELLNKKGIEAYFSGCLTLTLGKTYFSEKKTGEVLFVDPYIYINTFTRAKRKLGLQTDIITSSEVRKAYKGILPDYALSDFSIVRHMFKKDDKHKYDEYFERADSLLKRYSKARLIVTSRIHCALPCLAMGTPVIYIHSENENDMHNSRLKGILDFFDNIMYVNKTKIKCSKNFRTDEIKNSELYKLYAKNLSDSVETFIKK